MKAAAIVPAAGTGSRMGLADPKQFLELAGTPMLVHTVRALQLSTLIDCIVLVVPLDHLARSRELVTRYQLDNVKVVAGGRLRQDSVRAGLDALPAETDIVLVHDGARPFVSARIVEECLREAARCGAAMAAIPVKDTLKAVAADNTVDSTVDRRGLWQAQTPQVARKSLLVEAFAAAEQNNFAGTDEASLLERIGCRVSVVAGSDKNIKITSPDDLLMAEAILGGVALDRKIKIGHGYDAHRLVSGRPLVLGGVIVPHDLGLLGHSDADVLTHALCDAVLGALGAGDIGRHFPDTDPQYKDISSLVLLAQVVEFADNKGFVLQNADITVLAQKPRLAPHIEEMRANLARIFRVAPDAINVKATTTEEMGFVGRGEGIAAQAVVLLKEQMCFQL